jgi:hypothetical protein
LVLSGGGGCVPLDRDAFWDAYIHASCRRFATCPQTEQVVVEDCEQELDLARSILGQDPGCYDLCFYDERHARECVRELRHMECEPFLRGERPESCDAAWSCQEEALDGCDDLD